MNLEAKLRSSVSKENGTLTQIPIWSSFVAATQPQSDEELDELEQDLGPGFDDK